MAQALRIAVLKERATGETRVSATPETVRKLIALGAEVRVEQSAGVTAAIRDADFAEAGAEVVPPETVAADADIVLAVQAPDAEQLAGAKPGAWIIGGLDPFNRRDRIRAYADAG